MRGRQREKERESDFMRDAYERKYTRTQKHTEARTTCKDTHHDICKDTPVVAPCQPAKWLLVPGACVRVCVCVRARITSRHEQRVTNSGELSRACAGLEFRVVLRV